METHLRASQSSVVAAPGRVAEYLKCSRSRNTQTAYARDWERFRCWCIEQQVASLPASASTVAEYAADMANSFKPTSIHRHLMSISLAHGAAGLSNPVRSELVRSTLQGIRRSRGAAKSRKSALRAEQLKQIVRLLPDTNQGRRDKALLLIGYAGAFRRSELCALDVADLRFVEEGVRIHVKLSKTDQIGMGMSKDIGFSTDETCCPVACLRNWLHEASITEGPVFRSVNRRDQVLGPRLSPQSVSLVVKSAVALLGIDPDAYGAHSLRAGFITDCIRAGLLPQVIKKMTGHRNEGSLDDYFRETSMFGYEIHQKLGL